MTLKNTMLASFTVLLTACGGGGSNDTPSQPTPPVASPNSAPTLSGTFNISGKAASESILVLDANDSDDDSLSVTFDNKPTWLTHSLSNNQLTINVTPDFFDIGNHKLNLQISDGKIQTDYQLIVDIADNPDEYQNINLELNNIIGSWLLEDEQQIHFYANNEGLYIDTEKSHYPIQWSHNSGGVEFSVYQPASSEYTVDYIELEAVYEKDGRYRIKLEGDSLGTQVANTLASKKNQLSSSRYSLGHEILSSASLKIDDDELAGDLLATIKTPASRKDVFIPFNSSMEISSDVILLKNIESHASPVSLVFQDVQNFQNTELEFNITLNSVEIFYADKDIAITDFSFKLTLVNESINIDDYFELKEVLETVHIGTLEHFPLNPVSDFNLEPGNTYYSKFNVPEFIDGQEINTNASEINVINDTEAHLIINFANPATPKLELAVNYTLSGNILQLKTEQEIYQYELFTTHTGQVVVDGFKFEETTRIGFTPLEKGDDLSLSQQDLVGTYENLTFLNMRNHEALYMKITEGELGAYRTFYPDTDGFNYFQSYSSDGSILFTYKYFCNGVSSNLEDCYEYQKEKYEESNGESPIQLIRLKPFKIEGGKWYFLQHYNFEYKGDTFIYSSIRVFDKRVEN